MARTVEQYLADLPELTEDDSEALHQQRAALYTLWEPRVSSPLSYEQWLAIPAMQASSETSLLHPRYINSVLNVEGEVEPVAGRAYVLMLGTSPAIRAELGRKWDEGRTLFAKELVGGVAYVPCETVAPGA
jgi:hypothetical protein